MIMNNRYLTAVAVMLVALFSGDVFAQSVNRDRFEDNPGIDVRGALFGRIAGLNVSAGSGDSASENCSLTIHGRAPLVLIDGFPGDISVLTAYEIESVEILSDAVSSAIYGVRGANGVVLVKTRRAVETKLHIGVNYQYGLKTQYRSPEFADATLYANTLNSALLSDGLEARYSDIELKAFETGLYPYAYPNVNWWDEVYDDFSYNHRLNMTFEGGSRNFHHYTVVDYMYDEGFFKSQTADARYDTTPSDTRLSVRSNLDVILSETGKMQLGLLARFNEYNRANYGNLINAVYNTPAAAFPIRHANGMYGGSDIYGGSNPVAMLYDSGSFKTIGSAVAANLKFIKDFSPICEGLKAEVGVALNDYGAMTETAAKSYMYRVLSPSMSSDGTLITSKSDYGTNSKVISHSSGFRSLYIDFDANAKLSYDRSMGRHGLSASAIFDVQSHTASGRNNSVKRLSAGILASYSFDKKYEAGVVLNCSGSSYLVKGSRMMFYPALSLTWTISEEDFLKGSAVIDHLRLASSFGQSGYDGSLVHELSLQSFSSNGAGSYYFTDGILSYGICEGSLPVERIVPEKSTAAYLTLDLEAFDHRLSSHARVFAERRSDMLINASSTVSSVIGINVGKQCEGINDWRGADLNLAWNSSVGGLSYGLYANLSFLDSEVVRDDQDYQRYDYLYHKGNKVGQRYGLEAEGFFFSDADIRNTVTHSFSEVQPGDVKYVDQNGDFRIDDEDIVPIGYSSIPEWYFGFGFDLGWHGFTLSAAFSGVAGVTVNMLDSPLYKPLVGNNNLSVSFLEKETPWTLEDSGSATVPRLTTIPNANNYRNSSVWYRDGSFLKLRNLSLSYTFPENLTGKVGMEIYLRGTNLFSIDSLGIVDPERIGSGYPTSRALWTGVKLNF